MRFGGFGISIEHDDEWGPTSLSGDRLAGYVRIAGDEDALQLRWQRFSGSQSDLSQPLKSYFERLKRDAERSHVKFVSRSTVVHDRIEFSYRAVSHGLGFVVFDEPSARLVIAEVTSTRGKASLTSLFKSLVRTFKLEHDPETWALLGLEIQTPYGLELSRRTLLAGKVSLELKSKVAEIEATRWSFAEQLVAKHGIENWARSTLGLDKAKLVQSDDGLELKESGGFMKAPQIALVKINSARNEICTLRVRSGEAKWYPQWTWLGGSTKPSTLVAG